MLMHTAALARVQMASLQLHIVAVCTRRVPSYLLLWSGSGVPFMFTSLFVMTLGATTVFAAPECHVK